MTKICIKCKQRLPQSSFYKSASNKDGHRSDCKECNDRIRRLRDKGTKPEELLKDGEISRTRQSTPSPIRIEGDLAYIGLQNGLEAIIDSKDVKKVQGMIWSARIKKGKPTVVKSQANIILHRLLNDDRNMPWIDHINGNVLDNRASNLRPATAAQNAYNKLARGKSYSSKYKGVSWNSSRYRWRAQLTCKAKRVYITAYFSTEIEAAEFYDTAARKYFGKYGTYNFPLPGERSAI